jgi:hypothetical protein
METRSASLFSGAHSDEADYVAWNPTHPELFCSSSQKDRRIVFWDARRMFRVPLVCRNSDVTYPLSLFFITRKPARPTIHTQSLSSPDQLRARWRIIALCIIRKPALVHVLREGSRRSCSPSTVVSHGSCSGTSLLSFSLPTECDLITIGVLAADCVGRDV